MLIKVLVVKLLQIRDLDMEKQKQVVYDISATHHLMLEPGEYDRQLRLSEPAHQNNKEEIHDGLVELLAADGSPEGAGAAFAVSDCLSVHSSEGSRRESQVWSAGH